jgi:hypothetical protein
MHSWGRRTGNAHNCPGLLQFTIFCLYRHCLQFADTAPVTYALLGTMHRYKLAYTCWYVERQLCSSEDSCQPFTCPAYKGYFTGITFLCG